MYLTILSLLYPYQKTATQMMSLLMQEMRVIRVLWSFFVVYCQKCHLADTGYMKYIVTKYKDFQPDEPKLMDT